MQRCRLHRVRRHRTFNAADGTALHRHSTGSRRHRVALSTAQDLQHCRRHRTFNAVDGTAQGRDLEPHLHLTHALVLGGDLGVAALLRLPHLRVRRRTPSAASEEQLTEKQQEHGRGRAWPAMRSFSFLRSDCRCATCGEHARVRAERADVRGKCAGGVRPQRDSGRRASPQTVKRDCRAATR